MPNPKQVLKQIFRDDNGGLFVILQDGTSEEILSGGANGALPAATPITVDSTTWADTVSGSGTVAAAVTDTKPDVVLALAREGDAFPWLLITSDGLLCMSDGTADPYNNSALLLQSAGGNIFCGGALLGGVGVSTFTIDSPSGKIEFGTTAGHVRIIAPAGSGNGIILNATSGTVAFSTAAINVGTLPTSDPGVSGQLWNSSGVVHVSP